jgi:hypothetical protein
MQLERRLRPEAYCRRRSGYLDPRRVRVADAGLLDDADDREAVL